MAKSVSISTSYKCDCCNESLQSTPALTLRGHRKPSRNTNANSGPENRAEKMAMGIRVVSIDFCSECAGEFDAWLQEHRAETKPAG